MSIRLERPSSTPQYEDWAAILRRVTGHVFDIDELAHTLETDHVSAWILAYLEGEAVGIGVGRPSSIAGSLYAMARVVPEYRRQGVGSALYEALSAHARRAALTSLWGRVREDDTDARRFVERRGFSAVEIGRAA